MTPDDLSRVRTAIDDDARFTNDLEWPMPAKRINLYLALGRALVDQHAADAALNTSLASRTPPHESLYRACDVADDALAAAIRALAPEQEAPDATA